MAAGGRKQSIILLAATMAAICVGLCSAATYTVGDTTGWTIPPSSSFYSNWASNKSFQVGDVLVFNFPAGVHTVGMASKSSYDSCNITNLLSAPITAAPARMPLSSAGTHYFICTVSGHCSAGQKLSVTVTGPSPAPAPKPATPSPKPATSPSPSPSPSSTPAAAPRPATSAAPAPAPATPPPTPRPATSAAPTPAPATPPPTPSASSPAASSTTVPSPSPPTTGAAPSSNPTGGANAPSTPSDVSQPPAGNFAAPNAAGVGLLSLVSLAAAALLL